MQSNTTRVIVAVVGVALLVVLFFVFSGDDETGKDTTNPPAATTSSGGDNTSSAGATSTGASTKPVTIEIKDGEPVGGIADLTVDKGQDVDFIVDSDTASEVHVHGYDLMQDVAAGGKVEFNFPASIDGIFEIELEQTATQIAELTVNP